MDQETVIEIARWLAKNPNAFWAGMGVYAVSAVLNLAGFTATQVSDIAYPRFTRVLNLLGWNWGKSANDLAAQGPAATSK